MIERLRSKNRSVIIIIILLGSVVVLFFSTQFATTQEAAVFENFYISSVVAPVYERDKNDVRKNFVIDQINEFRVLLSVNIKTISNPNGIDVTPYEDFSYELTSFFVTITDLSGVPLEGRVFDSGFNSLGDVSKDIEDVIFLPEFGKFTINSHWSYKVTYWIPSIQPVGDGSGDFGYWWEYSYSKEESTSFMYRDPSIYPDPNDPDDPKWSIFDDKEVSFDLFGLLVISVIYLIRKRTKRRLSGIPEQNSV